MEKGVFTKESYDSFAMRNGLDMSHTIEKEDLEHNFAQQDEARKSNIWFFALNTAANLAVSAAGFMNGDYEQGWSALLNAARAGAYVAYKGVSGKYPRIFTAFMENKLSQGLLKITGLNKYIKDESDLEKLIETGFFAAAAGTNSIQIGGATTYFGVGAALLATINYIEMTVEPWRTGFIKDGVTHRATVKLSNTQHNIKQLIEKQANMEIGSEDYERTGRLIESQRKYARNIQSIAAPKEDEVSRWYQMGALGGALMISRAVLQGMSGLANLANPEDLPEKISDFLKLENKPFHIGLLEIFGASIFLFGAGKFSGERKKIYDARKDRHDRRHEMHHTRNPEKFLNNGNNNAHQPS